MKELLSVALVWTHLVAAVVWLGGMVFILRVAIPAARKTLGTDAGKLMGEITRRFTPLANGSILLLLLSGLALMAVEGFPGGTLRSGGGLATGFKLLLFLAMAAVHLYRGKVLAPRIAGAGSDQERAGLQRLSLALVRANLAAGLTVLLLTAVI
jgi:uncharacterized membrane protein